MNSLHKRIAAIPQRFAQWTERAQGLTPHDPQARTIAGEVKAEMETIGTLIEGLGHRAEQAVAQQALNQAVYATVRETPDAAGLISAATEA